MTGNEGNEPQGAEGGSGPEGAAAEAPEPPGPRHDPGGGEQTSRNWLIGLFAAAALLSVALFLFWPRGQDIPPSSDLVDLRTALFQALQRSEGDTLLFVNLPPAAGRYPGSILLFEGNIPLEFVTAGDSGLLEGQPIRLERQVRVASSAELGVGLGGSQGWLTAAVEALARREGQVEVRVAFDGALVEARDLVPRIAASPVARNVTEAGVDAYVIVRAWRGTVSLNIETLSGTSAQVLDSLSATLDSIAASGGAGVRFSGDLQSGQQGVLRLSEDDVFAYEGFELAPFYRLAAGIAPDDPLVGGETGNRPAVPRPRASLEAAIRQYLRLDPELLPAEDRERTLEELGPGAAAAVVSVMEEGDVEERERGTELLRELPPGAFALPAAAGAAAEGAVDAAVRARAVLEVSAATPSGRDSLGAALRDPNPAVRYLASEQLQAAGTQVARATLIAEADPGDPAVRTALSAARFQTAQLQSAVPAAAAVQGSDATLALGSVRATRSSAISPRGKLDVFVRGLASDDPEVVRESLRGLVEMGAEARPAIPAVERLLSTTQDRQIRDLARRALARLRAADG